MRQLCHAHDAALQKSRVCRLQCHIGAVPHGNTDRGRRECRSIVDTIAHHCDRAAPLQLRDDFELGIRQQFGLHFQAESLRDRTACALIVARQHQRTNAKLLQRRYPLGGIVSRLVAQRDDPERSLGERHDHHVFPGPRERIEAITSDGTCARPPE